MAVRNDRLGSGTVLVRPSGLRGWVTAALLAGCCALALAVRLQAAALPFSDDEASTLMAAQRIAETGAPVLPSGILYLHGATISYLLAPLAWFGWLDIDHLHGLRLVNVFFGVLAVPAAWLLARRASGSAAVGVLAALLVALDPAWTVRGTYLRMYALLGLAAIGVALAFLRVIETPPGRDERRALAAMVAAFWIAVFSQMVGALMLPALAIVSLALFGRELLGARRGVLAALGLCALAVVALAAIPRLMGASGASAGEAGAQGGLGFVGDHLIDVKRILDPNPLPLQKAFDGRPFGAILPLVLAALSGIVAGRFVLGEANGDAESRRGRAAGALLALGWIPAAGLAFLLERSSERYLLAGWGALLVLAAWGAGLLWPPPGAARGSGWWVRAAVAVAPVAMLLARDAWFATDVAAFAPRRVGGQLQALAAIEPELTPGDLVIVGFPPAIAWHALDRNPGIRFLNMSGMYAGPSPDGSPRDYWLGNQMLTSRGAFCDSLSEHPGSFVLLMQSTMHGEGDSALVSDHAPEFVDLVLGAAASVHEDEMVQAFRVKPVEEWTGAALDICPGVAKDARKSERTGGSGKDEPGKSKDNGNGNGNGNGKTRREDEAGAAVTPAP